MRHPFGLTASSPLLRGTRFVSPRTSSLLLGATLAAGALLVAPHTPRAWATPTVGGDENGPKVQIISPAYQDVLKGRARILVGVKVTQYNPSTIQLFLDDNPASNVLSLSSFSSSSFDWDTRLTADGPHKLSVRVTDTQGFRGWAEVNVYVNNQNVRDTVAPDLNWGNVQAFQQVSGQAQIQLQAKDNFGVKWIIVSLNPVAQATKQPAQRSWLLSKPPYNFNFDTTKVADGLYALSARAWDSMEQEGQSPTLTVGVVNSPVNATTVSESLAALKAMADAQKPKPPVPAPVAQPQKPKPVYVIPPPTPKADNHSGNSAKPPVANNSGKSGSTIPDGYTLLPRTVTPPSVGTQKPANNSAATTGRVTVPTIGGNDSGIEVARNTDAAIAAPVLSAPSTPSRLDATASAPVASEDSTPTTGDGTRVARASQPELDARVEPATATLSTPDASSDVLAPALSSGAQTGEVKSSEPVFVARLDTPKMAPRAESDPTTAALSTHESAGVASALTPARSPELSVALPTHIETARLALPSALDVRPVLSSTQTTLPTTIPEAQAVPVAPPATVSTAPAPVVSTPAAPRRNPGPSKAVLHKPYQRNTHVVNNINDKVAPTKNNATTVAVAPEVAPATVPQLSQPKTTNDGVVTTHTVVPEAKPAPRIAALPKPGTPDGSAIEVAPSASLMHPVITVSPVKVAFDKSLPAYYQARRTTTIRAIADHYGLPVELVAAANNWTTDMKILAGMKVQLPRQVQLSYNGQKVRGDVASLMAGDSTFTAMRFLFEHTGGTISWDATKKEVVAKKGASTIRVKIGSKSATVNNKEVMMQLAAFLFEGRTMVPARFFEEGLDAQVEWNPQTGGLVVAMAG
ncbi:hypothetical protein IAD21_02962 [Abditibacteriota bacterium]|nr:hypothetical protein IAD21_02962 [Abditibacteriota bacterium]